MITVEKEGVLLSKTDLEFENEGVLNPAVIREGDNVHLFYRAVQAGNRSTLGYCMLDGPLTIAERIKGNLVFRHRIRPGIQLVSVWRTTHRRSLHHHDLKQIL